MSQDRTRVAIVHDGTDAGLRRARQLASTLRPEGIKPFPVAADVPLPRLVRRLERQRPGAAFPAFGPGARPGHGGRIVAVLELLALPCVGGPSTAWMRPVGDGPQAGPEHRVAVLADPGPRPLPVAGAAPELAERLGAAAVAAFAAAGLRDLALVGFRLDAGDRPHVAAIDPSPDLSPGAPWPLALAASGLDLGPTLAGLVRQAIGRASVD